jgi:hypothetical protein
VDPEVPDRREAALRIHASPAGRNGCRIPRPAARSNPLGSLCIALDRGYIARV